MTFNQELASTNWFRKHNLKDAWMLAESELVGDHMDVIRTIQDRTACAISDGSFKNRSGAAGFTIIIPKMESSYTIQGNILCRARPPPTVPIAANCLVFLVS
jgi:hypothetical protein